MRQPLHRVADTSFRVRPRFDPVAGAQQLRQIAIAQPDDAKSNPLFFYLACQKRGPFLFSPGRLGGVRRPHQQRDVRLRQPLVDFGDEVCALLDVHLAEPGLEAAGGHGGSQFLDEVFVPGAMGEENFHRVLDLSESQSAASREKKQLPISTYLMVAYNCLRFAIAGVQTDSLPAAQWQLATAKWQLTTTT